jgi:hypothetical protein
MPTPAARLYPGGTSYICASPRSRLSVHAWVRWNGEKKESADEMALQSTRNALFWDGPSVLSSIRVWQVSRKLSGREDARYICTLSYNNKFVTSLENTVRPRTTVQEVVSLKIGEVYSDVRKSDSITIEWTISSPSLSLNCADLTKRSQSDDTTHRWIYFILRGFFSIQNPIQISKFTV